MYTKKSVALPDFVYILSRITTGGFIILSLVFTTAKVEDCHTLSTISSWFLVLALPCNSMLFFIRIRAVFLMSPLVTAGFGILWLTTVGAALTVPFGVQAMNLQPGRSWCSVVEVRSYSSTGWFYMVFYDTLVFIAISFRTVSFGLAETWKERLSSFISGKGVGHVSRSLLRTVQLYYLVTVGSNLFVLMVIVDPGVDKYWRAMSSMSNLALTNAMACRVYRLLKLGLIQSGPGESECTLRSQGIGNSLQFATTGTS
ncbi:unnamed protein product [Somion occarium]|uniref:G-protein coupled receptors family 1 profile domain-containing protein n=1 Tax=Somion occarium TaxID=3059160 RepID=A0ABP1D1H1_9APHY